MHSRCACQNQSLKVWWFSLMRITLCLWHTTYEPNLLLKLSLTPITRIMTCHCTLQIVFSASANLSKMGIDRSGNQLLVIKFFFKNRMSKLVGLEVLALQNAKSLSLFQKLLMLQVKIWILMCNLTILSAEKLSKVFKSFWEEESSAWMMERLSGSNQRRLVRKSFQAAPRKLTRLE